MLFFSNALAETFAEKVSPSMIPLSTDKEIQDALLHVSKVNDMYRNDKTRESAVPVEWHIELVTDFIEWVADHIPEMDADGLCRKFFDTVPLVRQYVRYQAQQTVDDYLPEGMAYIDAANDPEMPEDVTEYICSMKGNKRIIFMDSNDWLDSLFVPDFGDNFVHYDYLADYAQEHQDSDVVTLCTCRTAMEYMIAKAALAEQASISVINYLEDGNSSVLVIAMPHGRPIAVSPSFFASTQEVGDATVAEMNLNSFISHSEFEYQATALMALSVAGCLNAIEDSKRHSTDYIQSLAESGKLVGDVDFSVSVDDGGDALMHSNYDAGVSYSTVYSELLANDDIDADSIVDAITALAIEQAGEELATTGTIDELVSDMSELFTNMEIGTIARNDQYEGWKLLDGFYDSIENEKMIHATDELYDGLSDEEKIKIDAIMKRPIETPDRYNSVVVIDDSLPPAENGGQQAMMSTIPIGVPPYVRDDLVMAMRGLIVKLYLSGNGKMFLMSRSDEPSAPVEVCMLNWKNRSWTNGNPEELFEYLENTGIGDDMGLMPGDYIEFFEILGDGSTRSLGDQH